MAILSNLFGRGDGESNTSSDLISDLTAVASLDFDTISFRESVDEDGSSDTSFDSTSLGTDLDVGSLFASITDNMTDFDGLLG